MTYGKIKFDTFVFTESGVDVETETRDIPTQAELALKDSIVNVNAKLADNVVNEDNKLALKDDITSVDAKLAINVTNEDAKLATKADLVAGKLPVSQLPELAISDFLGAVADQTAMLALTGQKGDWCTRNDNGKVYIISGTDPTQLSSWTALTYPAAPADLVTSVAGRTGVVTLSTSDIAGLGTAATTASTDYATAAQGTLADSATQPVDLATVATTGAYNDLSGKPTIPTVPVDSVNTQTGTVVLGAGDVGAVASTGGTFTGLISADGKVSFPLGTAALPSLYPGSDTNTGIYSPGANQLAISTDGTGRLFVAAGGNCGIGTDSPQTKLEVDNGTPTGTLPTLGGLLVTNGGTAATTAAVCVATGSGPIFNVMNNGKVGINTITAERELDIKGNLLVGPINTTNEFQGQSLRNGKDSSVANTVSFIDFHNNLNTIDSHIFAIHKTNGGSTLRFGTTNAGSRTTDRRTHVLVIDEDKVGIGLVNPQAKLDVNGSGAFSGTVSSNGVVLTSDERFKTNITDANPQLADVTALGNSLRNWDWTEDAPIAKNDTRFLGLVAQEVETICPGIVTTIARTKDGAELTPEVVVPAVYETRTVPAVLDEEGEVIEPETTEQVLVTEEQITPATYEELDDSYKGIKNDVLVMKLLGAVAELSAKVAALEAS